MAERDEIRGWLSGRIPGGWGQVSELRLDQHEILVTLRIPEPQGEGDAEAARNGRIQQFRESTRDQRMENAEEAQRKYGRAPSASVPGGASGGGRRDHPTRRIRPHERARRRARR